MRSFYFALINLTFYEGQILNFTLTKIYVLRLTDNSLGVLRFIHEKKIV